MKTLIAYFSHEGSNTVNFDLTHLEKGHTRIVAEYLHDLIPESHIYRIQPLVPYPTNYDELCKVAKEEYDNNIERELPKVELDPSIYDTIYIGFPIWYRSYPRIIAAFLRTLDLNGKTVIPFCTNEEGSFGMADLELDRLVNSLGGTLNKGISIRGSEASSSKSKLIEFLK